MLFSLYFLNSGVQSQRPPFTSCIILTLWKTFSSIDGLKKPSRALWGSDSIHPSSGLTIISSSLVVLITVSLDLFRELLQMTYSLSGFSDAYCTCILLLLARPLLNCHSGKCGRRLLEESDGMANDMQVTFMVATFKAVNNFSQLCM